MHLYTSDGVSWLGPFLRVAVSKVLGLVSVSRATDLETLNIAKKWLSDISIFDGFLFVVFAGKSNQNMSEKCQKSTKNQLRSDNGI